MWRRSGCKMAGLVWIQVALAVITRASADYLSDSPPPSLEYCSAKRFSPRCHGDELVVMHNATYGRMRIGLCAKNNLGFIGCGGNVLSVLDQRCSGRRECEIAIPDEEMNSHSGCLSDLTTYLQASFSCQKAVQVNKDTCKSPIHIPVTHSNQISSQSVQDSGCGDATFIVEAQPGQILNISLLDFGWHEPWEGPSTHSQCKTAKYGHIVDPGNDHKMTHICGTEARVRHLVVTRGHRAQVSFDGKQVKTSNFLVRFTVEGCPDLVTPREAWLQRNDNRIIVGCNHTKQSWHLECNHTTWTGVLGNCSHYIATAKLQQASSRGLSVPHGVAIFTICAVAICISCIIIVAGVVCLKQNAEQEKKYQQALKNDYLKVHKYQNNEIPDLYQSYHSSNLRSHGNAIRYPSNMLREQHYSLGSNDSSMYNTVHTETTGYSKPEVPETESVTSPATTPGAAKTESGCPEAQRKFFVLDKNMTHGVGVV